MRNEAVRERVYEDRKRHEGKRMKAVKWGMVMAWVLGMLVAGEVKAGGTR